MARDDVYRTLIYQRVVIVLMDHPTEANHKTLLTKFRRISETLGTLNHLDLLPHVREEGRTTLLRVIVAIWGCNSICRLKTTLIKESVGG